VTAETGKECAVIIEDMAQMLPHTAHEDRVVAEPVNGVWKAVDQLGGLIQVADVLLKGRYV
jgi:hypothetical protein